MLEWIFVTGQPGSGKTTAVKKLVEFIQSHGKKTQGFYTEEVRKQNDRIGFDIVTVPDKNRGILARNTTTSTLSKKHKTGKYFVDVPSFEALAVPSLTISTSSLTENAADTHRNESNNIILILDEIGRMELHSIKFAEHIRQLVSEYKDSSTTTLRLVGAVTAPRYGHRVPFCDEISALPGVEVYNLTKTNRNDVVENIRRCIEDRGWLT